MASSQSSISHFFLFLLFSVFMSASGYAGTVSIHGNDSTYANEELIFLSYADQISGAENIVAKTRVAANGSFRVEFDVEKTTYVFANVGVYKWHVYVEPGGQYEILLPPRQDKTQGEQLNPYFEPTVVHLGIKEYAKGDVNMQIRMFNDAFVPYYNKHIMALAQKSDFSELDRDIARMEKPFVKSDNEYFNTYRKYRYGMLRHLAYQQRSRSVSDELFKDQEVWVDNISYMELFNKVYDDYLHYFSRTDVGEGLGAAIRTQSFDSLRTLLASDEVLGYGKLPDLVLLKSIHDEFYDDNYSRGLLLHLIDDFISTTQEEDLKRVAQSIRNKVTRLLIGFEPPAFELYDKDSNLVSLESLKGKYIYLNFCSCFSYTCMSEFRMLSTLAEKHGDILEIVTVIIDENPNVIQGFLERSAYTWKFLHYANQSTIIRDYDVRAFPTYYLLDREGKLVMSPAPAPNDEFEARLFKVLRGREEL